ncbi:hypothetical protein SVXHr_2739 [Halorhabdus sp. SVX81]|uniref:hypothetical protein n=1 Tax=Halorhabdus sp. SVX81 TaxID=2978283 RepID=UPI0023DCA40A|nr:hypothetical protein [Halorhabdus sp. SVX81]WEL18882.1 hypothetical protein SVXHr_2739 [Halorhabdus sp. SVX81]
MKKELKLLDEDGTETQLIESKHPDWEELSDPCPECGGTEFRHFTAEGGRYGIDGDVVKRRSDYWNSKRTLLTQCLSCKAVLQRHPAFDLLYELEEH